MLWDAWWVAHPSFLCSGGAFHFGGMSCLIPDHAPCLGIRLQCLVAESQKKRIEMLRYIHRNPMRRGLVKKREDWPCYLTRVSDVPGWAIRLKILLTSSQVTRTMLPPCNHLAHRCATLHSLPFPSTGTEPRRMLGMAADMLQSRRIAALWTVLAILFVALFPLAMGPFTATHGPVTAFRAIVFVALLLFWTSSPQTASISCHEPQLRRERFVLCVDECSPTSILVLRC